MICSSLEFLVNILLWPSLVLRLGLMKSRKPCTTSSAYIYLCQGGMKPKKIASKAVSVTLITIIDPSCGLPALCNGSIAVSGNGDPLAVARAIHQGPPPCQRWHPDDPSLGGGRGWLRPSAQAGTGQIPGRDYVMSWQIWFDVQVELEKQYCQVESYK